MENELMAALWSLKEDAAWAWKDALEGHPLNLHKLQLDWQRVERAVIKEDNESIRRKPVE
jgi:hypothetical protein